MNGSWNIDVLTVICVLYKPFEVLCTYTIIILKIFHLRVGKYSLMANILHCTISDVKENFTYSLAVTYPPTQPPIQPPTHLLTQSLTHSLNRPLTWSDHEHLTVKSTHSVLTPKVQFSLPLSL